MTDVERVKGLLAKYPGVWRSAVQVLDDLHWGPMRSVTLTSPDGEQCYVSGISESASDPWVEKCELAAAAINLLPVLLEIADLSLTKYEALGAAMGTNGMDGVVQGHHDATQAILDLNVAVKAWKKIREGEQC